MTSSVFDVARPVLFRPGALEDEPAFRSTLTQITCTGLQWGGLVGLVGVLVLVAVHAGVLGRPVAWWYPASMSPDVFVLWDKVLVVGACGGLLALGRAGCRVSVGRVVVGAVAIAVAAISLVHDAYRGILSVEYLVLVYLLAVAVIPYRPWQTLLLGAALTVVFYGLGHYGLPGTSAARPELVAAGHLVRMGFATVVLTGVSALLYGTRYRQHRARRRAEALHEQVAELERAKSQFFADVSVEFRTPLTLLMGALREALDGRLGAVPSALRDRLDLMAGQTRRMKRLVNQLYELSAVEEGTMTLSVGRHDLVALVRPLVPPFRQWAEDDGISFQVEAPEDGLDAWVDPGRVEDILGALLSNAIAYTPEGGTVRLRLGAAEETAILAVRDTGPGLPEDLRARVFDDRGGDMPVGEKTEGDRPSADRWIGVGIGLAHARALVLRHGGRIELDTEPGFGTECTVHLPRTRALVAEEDLTDEEDASPVPPSSVEIDRWRESRSVPETPADAEPPEDAPVVLVVEDEADMRDYLRSLLRPPYRVVTVPDGDTALERLEEGRVDLVIADDAGPGRDGASLCRAIRADDQLRSLPVILLTARPDDEPPLSGLQAGADALVAKPFDPQELETRVETLIEIRRLVRDQVRVPDWMKPKEATLETEEADFLQDVSEAVDAHIDNSSFGVDWLADELDLSARHLRRRLKDVTRLSPAGFIRARRLQHAAALLREGADTVADVADAVGYRDASYFSRLFRDTFGCSPTEYAEADPPADAPDAAA
jgi:signal transduction histidine kinase/DNA-binding response OmpR family regulator